MLVYSFFDLDDHHRFFTSKPLLVCGNTASMLANTRLASTFKLSVTAPHITGHSMVAGLHARQIAEIAEAHAVADTILQERCE